MLDALSINFCLQDVGIDVGSAARNRWQRELVNSRSERFALGRLALGRLNDQIAMAVGFRRERENAVGIVWIPSESPGAFKGYKDSPRFPRLLCPPSTVAVGNDQGYQENDGQ
jgi:hypothetical protein